MIKKNKTYYVVIGLIFGIIGVLDFIIYNSIIGIGWIILSIVYFVTATKY